jgi:hypothetical protein
MVLSDTLLSAEVWICNMGCKSFEELALKHTQTHPPEGDACLCCSLCGLHLLCYPPPPQDRRGMQPTVCNSDTYTDTPRCLTCHLYASSAPLPHHLHPSIIQQLLPRPLPHPLRTPLPHTQAHVETRPLSNSYLNATRSSAAACAAASAADICTFFPFHNVIHSPSY